MAVIATASEEKAEGKTVYRSVDEGGVVEFTDVPGKSSEEIKVPPAQTYKSLPVKKAPPVTATTEKQAFRYDSLEITSPKNEESIFDNAGNATISITVSPAVASLLRHKLEVSVDGKVVSGAGPSFQLTGLDRGSHTINAKVVDGNGVSLIKAKPTVFYIRQHSKLFKKPATRP